MTAPLRIVTLSVEELEGIVELAVKRALAANTAPSNAAEVWLTAEEAGAILRCNARTVKKMATKGQIPHDKLGRIYRFLRVDIEARRDRMKQAG